MDLSNESDDRLLARMGRNSDPDGSKAAWGELYRRHFKFLYGVCFRATRDGDKHEAARDLATDAFRRAYEAAGTFALPEGTPPEDVPSVVRAWLCRIAKNLRLDQYRKEKDHEPILLDHEEWQDIGQKPASAPTRHTAEVCHVISEVLDDRERDIIVTTFEWYDPDKANQRLPNAVLQALAEKWKTKPDTIRQIRKRALAKLDKALRTGTASAPTEREDR